MRIFGRVKGLGLGFQGSGLNDKGWVSVFAAWRFRVWAFEFQDLGCEVEGFSRIGSTRMAKSGPVCARFMFALYPDSRRTKVFGKSMDLGYSIMWRPLYDARVLIHPVILPWLETPRTINPIPIPALKTLFCMSWWNERNRSNMTSFCQVTLHPTFPYLPKPAPPGQRRKAAFWSI